MLRLTLLVALAAFTVNALPHGCQYIDHSSVTVCNGSLGVSGPPGPVGIETPLPKCVEVHDSEKIASAEKTGTRGTVSDPGNTGTDGIAPGNSWLDLLLSPFRWIADWIYTLTVRAFMVAFTRLVDNAILLLMGLAVAKLASYLATRAKTKGHALGGFSGQGFTLS